MAATTVRLKTVNFDKTDVWDRGGELNYTYERIGNNMQYYVRIVYRQGYSVASQTITTTAVINGITKTKTTKTKAGSLATSAALGPWDIPIASAVDTTIPGCTIRDGYFGNATFAAVVKAGGKLTIPVSINDNGTIIDCDAVYVNVGGTIYECEIYTNVNGTIVKIE